MQHEPWIGSDYEQGVEGARVLVAAYSHWSAEPDTAEFTKREVRAWVGGDEPEPFGPRLRAFFNIDRPDEFWRRIAFFNTLPRLVGGPGDRFAHGDQSQLGEVSQRVLDVIEAVQPDRIFVFSRKAWHIWPDYTGSLKEGTLRIADVGEFDAGTYKHPRGEAVAFGFTHPQFTPVVPTRIAVAAALKVAVDDLRPSSEH